MQSLLLGYVPPAMWEDEVQGSSTRTQRERSYLAWCVAKEFVWRVKCRRRSGQEQGEEEKPSCITSNSSDGEDGKIGWSWISLERRFEATEGSIPIGTEVLASVLGEGSPTE